jgi:hypothetical protein
MSRVVDCALGSKPQGFFKLTVYQVVLDGEKISKTYLAKAFHLILFFLPSNSFRFQKSANGTSGRRNFSWGIKKREFYAYIKKFNMH